MKLLIIDGNSIINRAFYGIRLLTASDGTYTNAVVGFLNTYLKVYAEENPDGVCVCFDLPAPTFRHIMFDGYKAGRHAMPEELKPQILLLKEILDLLGIQRLELEGYEADDLLGTLSARCEEKSCEAVILTGDRDSLQLAGPNTKIKINTTKSGQPMTTDYDVKKINEDFGIQPPQLIEVKALMGDKSDNIPGIAGIGEKTALSLIKETGNIEELYRRLEELKLTKTTAEKLINGKDSAFISRKLAEINRNVPVDFDISASVPKVPDGNKLYDKFVSLGFESLLKRMKLEKTAGMESKGEPASAIECPFTRTFGETTSFILESDGEIPSALTVYDGINVCRTIKEDEEFAENIKAYFNSEGAKASHDLKKVYRTCFCAGIETCGSYFDTFLAAYILNKPQDIYQLASLLLPGKSLPPSEPGFTDRDIPAEQRVYAEIIFGLVPILKEGLRKENTEDLYYSIELPLAKVLAEMEYWGFSVDPRMLKEYGILLDKAAKEDERQIYASAGTEFNINSPKQLGEVLFEKLGLPVIKKTKSGYSTDADVMEKLNGKHEIISLILEYRSLTKLKSTYTDGLLKVISPADGRVHSTFYQTGTATGRISSSDPNLQNIPIRTELGREIRRMFIPAEGYLLADADYSQIELRLLANIARDSVMMKAFEDGDDIHTITSSQVFGVPLSEVTSSMRSKAKAVNFGIVYGISDFALADDIKVSRYEAREYINKYFETYPQVKEYLDSIIKIAKEQGYVETIFNRRRYIPDINSKNFHLRSAAERIALNTPIQGSAADIIKLAMVRLSKRLKKEKYDARLILQIHDELIVEVREDQAEKVCAVLKEEMENAVSLSVELPVEAHTGKNWLDI